MITRPDGDWRIAIFNGISGRLILSANAVGKNVAAVFLRDLYSVRRSVPSHHNTFIDGEYCSPHQCALMLFPFSTRITW